MEDYQTIKKQADEFRRAKNYADALPLYKQLWEEHRENCNEWEGWAYALCLKQQKDYKHALDICREVYKLKPKFENIKGVYAWSIYYTEIAIDKINFEKEPIFFKAGEGILKLSKQEDKSVKKEEDYPCVYTMTVIKILKYLNDKAIYPTDKILEWTSKLNVDFLDTNPYSFDNEGKSRELAPKKEQYFMWRTKALFKKELYQECIDLCEIALHSLEKFHYDNDIWFTRRITLSNKKLGNSEDTLNQLKEILKKKKEWYIQKEIAEILFEQGNLEESRKYLIEACLNFGEAKNKINLYVFFAKLLISQNEIEQAKKHIEFAYYVRIANDSKIDVELQKLLTDYQIDITKKVNLKDFEKELKQLWEKLKFSNQTRLTGTIKSILPNRNAGFIETENKKSYYFKINNFLNRQQWCKIDQKVTFFLEEGFDRARNKKTKNAINVKKY